MKLIKLNAIDSTNEYIKLNKSFFSKNSLAVYSFNQTNGKGQRGKKWVSEPHKNTSISFYFRIEKPSEELLLKTNLFTDKFMTMNLVQNQDYFNIRYQVKPFMIWIWISVLLISFAGLTSLLKKKNYEN